LPIKETDRLNAMKIELEKCGAKVRITADSLHLEQAVISCSEAEIDTYQDHRMAMAFAPLALRIPLQINQADVVSKSYPDFWKDLKRIGFEIST
jgi:3-phosphoshikimate 1-carboxyvinyltransferase